MVFLQCASKCVDQHDFFLQTNKCNAGIDAFQSGSVVLQEGREGKNSKHEDVLLSKDNL